MLGLVHGLGVAAMGTFPLAFWPEMTPTSKARYGAIMDDLQMIGSRNMMCGMHVHVAVPDLDARVNLMTRLTPYLPLFLALSTSSPFWQGHLTGLVGYRLAAYDELPRTGLPELFRTKEDYDEYIAALVGAGVIPNASYIWWAIRPSVGHPTIELRVADSCTRVEDAIAIAALFRCLVRALDRNRELNADFDSAIQPYQQVVQRLQSRSRGEVEAVAFETVHHDLDTQPGHPAQAEQLPASIARRTDTVMVVATSVSENSGGNPQTVHWNLRLGISDVDGKLMISRLESIR